MSTSVNTLLSRADTDSVTTLTLNHPPANTLTPELPVELEGAFAALARDETVKAVAFTGAGRFFLPRAEIPALAGAAPYTAVSGGGRRGAARPAKAPILREA